MTLILDQNIYTDSTNDAFLSSFIDRNIDNVIIGEYNLSEIYRVLCSPSYGFDSDQIDRDLSVYKILCKSVVDIDYLTIKICAEYMNNYILSVASSVNADYVIYTNNHCFQTNRNNYKRLITIGEAIKLGL